ncbi:MAG: Nif3-like dinuclear metal center hexameric protein [Spirochaetaceae bacterium]|nr:Nif3-like dinuclear metal center hexameric protein [Spirochaetaceae bacterium]
MKVKDFDIWIRNILRIDEMVRIDSSLNGLQVGREEDEIEKIAFTVDASLESFTRAIEAKAQMLFVHHGLYWGRVIPITGSFYKRIEMLIKNNLALYTAHLPLDINEEFGNNAGLAKILGLQDLQPFGDHKGLKIGFKGILPEPLSRDEIINTLFGGWDNSIKMLPFGKDEINSVALISGDAPFELEQAIDENIDLYLTGEASHVLYHRAQEAAINVLFGGHYATEIYGVKLLADKVSKELSLDTVFIDIPTGL